MKIIPLILFVCLFQTIHAQTIEVGAWLGGTNSFNDINTETSFKTTRPAGGLIGKYDFNNRIAIELMMSYGETFSADQYFAFSEYQIQRNEASKTSAFDMSFSGEFNFLPLSISQFFLEDIYDFTPYLSAGLGVALIDVDVYSRIADDYISYSAVLREDDQRLNTVQFNIPLSAGVKIKLSDDFILAGEFGSRLLFTDYYDNLSTVYNQAGIDHNPGTIKEIGRKRGDPEKNDVFNLFGLQITYIIPKNDCPRFNK